MTFEEARNICHVRSAIYREGKPDKKYWKNHNIPFEQRVPLIDQQATDWKEYDPKDHEPESYYMA